MIHAPLTPGVTMQKINFLHEAASIDAVETAEYPGQVKDNVFDHVHGAQK